MSEIEIIQSDDPVAAYDEVLRRIEERTSAALARGIQLLHPEYVERHKPTDGELEHLIAALVELHGESNYPIKYSMDPNEIGRDWFLGACEEGDVHVHVSTDRVRGSELVGGAVEDAKAWVALRNAVPVLIACLVELRKART